MSCFYQNVKIHYTNAHPLLPVHTRATLVLHEHVSHSTQNLQVFLALIGPTTNASVNT